MEPLRTQARSLEGPLLPQMHYQIPFTTREEFEAAWPHLLRVASKGAPIVLLKSPYTRLGKIEAGVFIHCPPKGSDEQRPTDPKESIKSGSYWRWARYIELIVDGEIVDLNRIELPAETQIIDKRFENRKP